MGNELKEPVVVAGSLIAVRVPADSSCKDAYFEVYNNPNIKDATHVAKLHFNDMIAEYHTGIDGKKVWYPNNAEKFAIWDLLNKMSDDNDDYSNWSRIKFEWNHINKMLPENVSIDEYFTGEYDEKYADMYEGIKETYHRWVPAIRVGPEKWGMEGNVTDEMYAEGVINYLDENKYFAENGIVFPAADHYPEATVASGSGIRITVVMGSRSNAAYFRVYDNEAAETAAKVAQLHFKDNGMELDKGYPDEKGVWIPSAKEIDNIKKVLSSRNKDIRRYTTWQYMCYCWNVENDLIPFDIDTYFSGRYDNLHVGNGHLQKKYVPSTTEMPETWECGDRI